MTESDVVLIVTGDDFGLSPLVNSAVIQAHQQGILTSASLMVNGGAFDEAVALAKENPGLSVGIHITLARGAATLSTRELSPLVNEEGDFSDNPVWVGFRYFFDRSIRPLLEKEIEAQIRKFCATGLVPSHIDGHIHLHVHPAIADILARLCRKYSIPAFRLPRESLAANLKADPGNRSVKSFYALTYDCLCAFAEKKLRERQILFPDRFIGLLSMGRMDESYMLKVLDDLLPGVTEISMHPALALPPELARWAPHYEYGKEFDALISPRVKEKIRAKGIQLAGYHQLGRFQLKRKAAEKGF